MLSEPIEKKLVKQTLFLSELRPLEICRGNRGTVGQKNSNGHKSLIF